VEAVGTVPRLQPAVACEHATKRGHLVQQHLVSRGGSRLSPELLDQAIATDELVRPQQQQRQQRALSPGRDRQLAAFVVEDYERAKQAKVHCSGDRTTGFRPQLAPNYRLGAGSAA
jgi:hypothetical protein